VITLVQANALHIPLPSKSVQCVVTSPPYWGLRDYGTAQWIGGDEACNHIVGEIRTGAGMEALGAKYRGGGHKAAEYKPMMAKGQCPKCGAVRVDSQLGLEKAPEEYVEKMVAVFREVWRVLRDDGTLWLNLGDSYAGSWGNYSPNTSTPSEGWSGLRLDRPAYEDRSWRPPNSVKQRGLKTKDMVGIPWRVAFALQADGWYLRSDVIWSKPNPMPESVRDRPTKSHEYLFLLSKSERYYYDAEAIKEPCQSGPSDIKKMIEQKERIGGKNKELIDPLSKASATTNIGQKRGVGDPNGRNRRTVWEIATSPYSGAHFATFPPALVEPCVLAGTSARGQCPECGAPWTRMIERTIPPAELYTKTSRPDDGLVRAGQRSGGVFHGSGQAVQDWKNANPDITTGWAPSCDCDAGDPVPQLVLDPFSGSGTTGEVCLKNGRRYVGVELKADYIELARERLYNRQIGFGI
jgi:DNA modification methylase